MTDTETCGTCRQLKMGDKSKTAPPFCKLYKTNLAPAGDTGGFIKCMACILQGHQIVEGKKK